MTDKLQVMLAGKMCGVVAQSKDGDLTFEYAADYSSEATPISLSMPVAPLLFPKRLVHPFMQGLLPDNEYTLRRIAKTFGANHRNPFSMLKHVGREVAGALEFVREGESADRTGSDTGGVRLTEHEVEQLLLGKVEEYGDGLLATVRPDRLSLAGAQPKLVLHRDAEGHWWTPSQTRLSTHILKPVPPNWRSLDVIEHQTMLAARLLGLRVADSELATFGDTSAYITTRYDRGAENQRIHQEDLCQALSISPEKKYQRQDGGPGVGAVANLIRSIYYLEDRQAVAEAFFAGLVFNTLSWCSDAHAKNYSLLLDGRGVALSPLYDLASTALFGSFDFASMSINGKYRFDEIRLADFLVEARRLNLDEGWAAELVQRFQKDLLEVFRAAGEIIQSQVAGSEAKRVTKRVTEALKVVSTS